ncbi:MAG: hypothetical protein K0R18_1296 [Bacillales bacterium]|nr:hypothetical protein [Bacillales bacterium]
MLINLKKSVNEAKRKLMLENQYELANSITYMFNMIVRHNNRDTKLDFEFFKRKLEIAINVLEQKKLAINESTFIDTSAVLDTYDAYVVMITITNESRAI